VSLSERTTGGGRSENVREWKYWHDPSIHEYNIMYCTINCWLLGEHGDRGWVSNGGRELIWWKHGMYRPEALRQNPLRLSIYT
jgi:hypothetical protein